MNNEGKDDATINTLQYDILFFVDKTHACHLMLYINYEYHRQKQISECAERENLLLTKMIHIKGVLPEKNIQTYQ